MNPTQFSIDFVLAVLATWRVTHLLAEEDGPADLVVKFRGLLGDSLAGQLMDCFKCLSVWVAMPAALFVTRRPLEWVMVWLALSGAACLLQELVPATTAAPAQPYVESFNTTEPEPDQGAMSHVLRPETFSPAERPLRGKNHHPGTTANQTDDGAESIDGPSAA